MILIFAFKPFGLKGALSGTNSSEQVLDQLKALAPTQHHYRTLDVGSETLPQLRSALEETDPAGVVGMGEFLLAPGKNIMVEPYAVDTPVTSLPLFGGIQKIERSTFASSREGHVHSSSIGTFYCNATYLEAIRWARSKGNRPVTFIHVPVVGDREAHCQQVRQVMWEVSNA
jgi:pyrrolidone-carboxylate peptidase